MKPWSGPVVRFLLLAALFVPLAAGAQDDTKMKISSPAFSEGAMIPGRFTADGANVNPPLEISGVLPGAKSLALIVDDPDAPAGTWNHWLLWNIAPDIASVEEDSVPAGAVAGKNDFGRTVYLGPSPPSGTHRYFFHLFALDVPLDLPSGATRAQLDRAMKGHILATAELMGRYGRSR